MPTIAFTLAGEMAGTQVPVAYLVFNSKATDGTVTPFFWGDRPVAMDGCYLDPRITSFGQCVRALSDWMGAYQGASFVVTVSDWDHVIGALLESGATKYLAQREAILYLHEDTLRRAGYDPLSVMRGIVKQVDLQANRLVAFTGQDYLTAEFGPLSASASLPRRTFDTTHFPALPAANVGRAEPIVYGSIRGTARASGGTHGPVLPIYTGLETIGGKSWGRFVLAGHACKVVAHLWWCNMVQDWYFQNGMVLAPGWEHADQGGDDWAQLIGSTLYREFGGRRYTVVYVRADTKLLSTHLSGTYPLTFDVDGVEDAGDGTGTLITDPVLQYEHCARNFLLGDYQAGAWLSTPTSSISGAPLMDSSTWTAVAEQKASDGHVGAGAMGLENEREDISTWLERWNLSADVFCGFDRRGRLIVSGDDLVTPAVALTDADIHDGTFATPSEWDRLANVIPYNFRRDYATAAYESGTLAVSSASSIAAFGGRRVASTRELWFTRDASTARHLMVQWLRRQKDLPRKITFSAGLHALSEIELGDRISVTHRDGPAASAPYTATMQVTRIAPSLSECTVELEGYDLSNQEQNPAATDEVIATSTAGTVTVQSMTTAAAAQAMFSGSRYMGGSRSQGYRHTAWAAVFESVQQSLDWSLLSTETVSVQVAVRTTAATVPVSVRIWDNTNAQLAATAQSATSTSWTTLTFTLSAPSTPGAVTYEMQVSAGAEDAADVFAISNPGLVVAP